MKVLHHDDMDGKAAANCVYQQFRNQLKLEDFFEMSYTTKFPIKECKDEIVFVVDFSIQDSNYKQFEELYKNSKDLIYIDHHKTTIETINKYPWMRNIKGLVKENISGAALTYMYLKYGKIVPLEKIPLYLRYIDDFDCWKLKLDGVMEFKYGVETHNYDPCSIFWDTFIECTYKDIERIIKEGTIVARYNKFQFKNLRDKYAYESKYDGKSVLIINADGFSQLFGEKLKEYDFCCLWNYTGKEYSYSIYSDQNKENPVDCSLIAKQYGGGGHPGASGFQTKELVEWCKK